MQESSYQGPERRRYPRIPFWYIVRYRRYRPPAKYSTARSKNLSLGGILLETNRFYPVSTMLEIELDVPMDIEHHVYAKILGKVVRSSVVEADKAYDTAIQFTSLPIQYQKEIQRLVEVFAKS